MNVIWQVLAGLGLGMACSCAHLALLRHELRAVEALTALRARARLMRGFPLRMLIWVPVIALVTQMGAAGCLGFGLAMACGRWLLLRRAANEPVSLMR